MTLLRLSGLCAFYGPAQALFGVDLAVDEGEVVALMGRNGMGKTTTIRATMGLVRAAGFRQFAGRDLARDPPHVIARAGIGLVPEGRRLFAGLTVRENLLAAARPGAWDTGEINRLFPRLAERSRQTARTLSGGEQQMLAIARALMTNPRLLILDEATEGLAPLVRAEIWTAVETLSRTGMAILVVDKSLTDLSRVADRVVILGGGRDVWTGHPGALTDALAARHLGV